MLSLMMAMLSLWQQTLVLMAVRMKMLAIIGAGNGGGYGAAANHGDADGGDAAAGDENYGYADDGDDGRDDAAN